MRILVDTNVLYSYKEINKAADGYLRGLELYATAWVCNKGTNR